jgi:predicted NAD/FAD-dependent oxidoreductase
VPYLKNIKMAPKLLIIGGGFAGVHCAKGATAAGYEVTVVDK